MGDKLNNMKRLIIAAALFLVGIAANAQDNFHAVSLDSIVWENKALDARVEMHVSNGILIDNLSKAHLGEVQVGVDEDGWPYCILYPYMEGEVISDTFKFHLDLEVYPDWMELYIIE